MERREFFAQYFTTLLEVVDEFRGHTRRTLASLAEMDDDQLAAIVPMRNNEFTFHIQERAMSIKRSEDGILCDTVALGPEEKTAFRHFNGRDPIEEIAAQVSVLHRVPPEKGFAVTKELFLRLITSRACLPANQ